MLSGGFTRAQAALAFIVLTAAIAFGLTLHASATTIYSLFDRATEGLFLPLLLALILSFLLEPLVQRFEREGLGRTLAIFLSFLVLLLLLGLLGYWLAPSDWGRMWSSLRADFPRYLNQGVDFLTQLQERLHAYLPMISEFDLPDKARELANALFADVLLATPALTLRLGSLLVIVPLFCFFFLRDGNRIVRGLISLTPNRYFELVLDLSHHINTQMAYFIRGRILEALIVGLVTGLGLSLTDIRYAPILGVVAGVANLVPYIGPIVGMIPGFLIAFVDLGLGWQFWWVVITYVLIAQVIVDSFILIPILISRVANLHPLWVILAIIMGGRLYGVVGMIIGVPVFSIFRIVFQGLRSYRSTFALPYTEGETSYPRSP